MAPLDNIAKEILKTLIETQKPGCSCMAKITDKEFENLARLILETSGIQLDKGKEYLVEARLESVLERYGLDSFNDLYNQAISDATVTLKASIVDAITTNETCFFRDNSLFELLKNKIIPDFIDQKSGLHQQQKIPLNIWSAACSTGQEVYSLGMTLDGMSSSLDRFDISILGTDISNEAIAKASYGKYNQFDIERGLSSHYLDKYFNKLANGWKIKDEIRAMVRFSQLDLNRSLAGLGSFDIILCCNVAIYFTVSGKISLFQKLAKVLKPDGVLIVGGSESLMGLANDFVPRHYLNSVFYQLRKSDSATSEPSKLGPYRQTENAINVYPPKYISPKISPTEPNKLANSITLKRTPLQEPENKTSGNKSESNSSISTFPQTNSAESTIISSKTEKKNPCWKNSIRKANKGMHFFLEKYREKTLKKFLF